MSTASYILNLDQVSSDQVAHVGGKAAKLGEMRRAGARVPDGFVLTTAAFERMTSVSVREIAKRAMKSVDPDAPETIEHASEEIIAATARTEIDGTILKQLESAYQGIGAGRVAVRSSATAEDLDEASFAGQYESYLNVEGMAELVQSVKRCYASLWTPRAIAYRIEKGIDSDAVKLAVLVQSMVHARTAGVLFTDDPTARSRTQMVIESNFGLGESVVSGVASPDRYIVARPESSASRRYRLLSSEIGSKDLVIQSRPAGQTGTVRTKPTEDMALSSSLSEGEVLTLARLGSSLETIFSGPQDVEWAIDDAGQVHILQSRPITARRRTADRGDEIAWTRGYSDDYWNDNVTPLFFDLLGDQLTHIVNNELNAIMGYKDMPADLLKLYKGHVYFNLDVLRKKVVNEIPPFLRSEDVLNYFPEGHGPYGKETMRKLPFALKNRLMAEIRVTLLDGNGSMSKTASVYDRWTKEIFVPYCAEFDSKLEQLREHGTERELWDLAAGLDKVMMQHFRLVRYGIPVHNIGMNLMTHYLLRRFLGPERAASVFPILVTGLEHKTNETNRRVNELAQLARRLPTARNAIASMPSDDVLAGLRKSQNPEAAKFLSEFTRFIRDFGVRGFTREPYYSRWAERPALVFDVLKPMLVGNEVVVEETGAKMLSKRVEVEQAVERDIRAQKFGGIKFALLKTVLGLSRTYITFREDQRFNLDRWITRNRALYLEIGRRLVQRGIISQPAQVFFFRRGEIRRAVNGQMSDDEASRLSATVLERESEFKENENVTPPKFIHGSRMYNDLLHTLDKENMMRGLPASQGVVSGPVRVLHTIDDIPQVRDNEILVVPRTDPGWTPVFSHISGLVTETGGILSHGAVVSREYGIPAVTNIRNACGFLKTGQMVTVDGNMGTIYVHRK